MAFSNNENQWIEFSAENARNEMFTVVGFKKMLVALTFFFFVFFNDTFAPFKWRKLVFQGSETLSWHFAQENCDFFEIRISEVIKTLRRGIHQNGHGRGTWQAFYLSQFGIHMGNPRSVLDCTSKNVYLLLETDAACWVARCFLCSDRVRDKVIKQLKRPLAN